MSLAGADHELLARIGGEPGAHQQAVIGQLMDALRLQGLDQVGAELFILEHLLADALDQLLY
jgi:hypothetical protein